MTVREPTLPDRRTAIYWLHHIHPTLTCGAGDCTVAESQCESCRQDEQTIRKNERSKMRDGLLSAMGLNTRHDSVQVRHD